ncbi:hypothetical protein BGX27_010742, partial [Mortierella sp. AM989]
MACLGTIILDKKNNDVKIYHSSSSALYNKLLTIADIKTGTILDNLISLTGDRYLSREKTSTIMAVYDNLEKSS